VTINNIVSHTMMSEKKIPINIGWWRNCMLQREDNPYEDAS